MASLGSTAARGVIFLIQLYRHTMSPLRLHPWLPDQTAPKSLQSGDERAAPR